MLCCMCVRARVVGASSWAAPSEADRKMRRCSSSNLLAGDNQSRAQAKVHPLDPCELLSDVNESLHFMRAIMCVSCLHTMHHGRVALKLWQAWSMVLLALATMGLGVLESSTVVGALQTPFLCAMMLLCTRSSHLRQAALFSALLLFERAAGSEAGGYPWLLRNLAHETLVRWRSWRSKST